MADQPTHSPLGASGAERWMECPGSVALLHSLMLPESDEEDWRVDGTTAHAGAAACLERGLEAWEIVGEVFNGQTFDAAMAVAVQVYLDGARSAESDTSVQAVEYRISAPSVHPSFYGTADHWCLDGETLTIDDYKHGQGIEVEAVGNPQIRYYAYGVLLDPRAADVKTVRLRIWQPRIFSFDGVKEEIMSADALREWAETTLIPAMVRTEMDDELNPGPWCRFCPAKLVCPVLGNLYRAAAVANPKTLVGFDGDTLGREYLRREAVKFYLNALEKEVLRRHMHGEAVKHTKLVNQKANRVWKDGAVERFDAEFGEKTRKPGEFRSPAEMEKAVPEAKGLVKEWAYTPHTGYTVALETDKRAAIRVDTSKEVFADTLKNMGIE